MKNLFLLLLLCTSTFLFGQAFYDFESGSEGWTTDNVTNTHLGRSSRSSTWSLATQTGGTNPLTLGSTWYGTPNAGQRGAEKSYILSPVLYVNQPTVTINFDSYSANEGGFLYDREAIQASINGGPFFRLHNTNFSPLHQHADRTFRNITLTLNANVGDEVLLRIIYDTGDNVTGFLPFNILGWYVDNIAIDGADDNVLEVGISMPESVIYYGYAPLSCTTLEASSTGGFGEATYTWSIDNEVVGNGASIPVCAEQPECMLVTVIAQDELGNTAEANVLVEVVDVSCQTNGNNPKVLLCHNHGSNNSGTICVSASAVAAHLAHGDVLGDCDAASPCTQAMVQAFDDLTESAVSRREKEAPIAADATAPLYDLSTMPVEDKRVHLFPNPATAIANLKFHQALAGPVSIEVYNQLGQLVLMTAMEVDGGDTRELNVSALQPGIYELKIKLENSTFHTEQLVVMR